MVLRREDALHVEPHGLLEVVVDQPEHLVGLVDLDRPLLQPVVVAQRGHAADVDAGDRRAAEVDRDPVGRLMRQRRLDPSVFAFMVSGPLSK